MMKCIATRSPSISCKQIRAALLATATNVSRVTVSRCVSNQFGLKSNKPACEPRLTTSIKPKRLDFA